MTLQGSIEGFFHAYLECFLYWLSFPLGSLALLMIYRMTGGAWGKTADRFLTAATQTLAPYVVLFIPVLFGVHEIYRWAGASYGNGHPLSLIGGNKGYLTVPFYSLRSIFYLLGWVVLAIGVLRKNSPAVRAISAGGLVFYGLSSSFASFDWQMSLEPEWTSTMYGLIFGVGQVLQAWAGVLVLAAVSGRFARTNDKTQRDMSNLLLTMVIIWAYVSFMQYLIIWSGNLPDEVKWFYPRTHGGWQTEGILLAIFLFALPFSLLLFRSIKTRARWVLWIGALVLGVRLIEQDWVIAPAFHPEHYYFNLWILPCFVAIGGIWLLLFRAQLKSIPPEEEEVAHA